MNEKQFNNCVGKYETIPFSLFMHTHFVDTATRNCVKQFFRATVPRIRKTQREKV